MGIISETRFIERLQFFNGQRLFASDLQGLEAFNREMRWLHNKSLHQPGIGSGFAVYGKKEDRGIKIKPGYAIDSLGREIVLTETLIEPVPPVAGEDDGKSVFYDLTVSYPDDEYLEEAETREGICLPRGVVRLREEPVFCWVRLERDDLGNLHVKDPKLQNDIKDGLKIVLARVEVLNCQLNSDLSIAGRRSARPAKQPYIACGETSVNSTDWQVWVDDKTNTPIGMQLLRVDTSSAQFRTTPCYSAHIVGNRFFSMAIDEEVFSFLLEGFISVVEPDTTWFTLRVLMPEMSIGNLPVNLSMFFNQEVFEPNGRKALLKNGWHVVWMGIEG